jgi:hypothetical protein
VTATGTIGMANIAEGTVSGVLTLTKTGTTARTATFPDAAITVAGSASALTSGRVPYATTGGLLTDDARFTYGSAALTIGDGTGVTGFSFNGTSGDKEINWKVGGNLRWVMSSGGTESGTDTGSLWRLRARTDAGGAIDDPISIVRASGGAITLARPVTCTGAVTVPNGTAAAPGIRTTTYAHGLYNVSATEFGFAAAGVATLEVVQTTGALGAGLRLKSVADENYCYIITDRLTNELRISPGSGTATGANIQLYGSSHTTASTGNLRTSTTAKFTWNATGIGFFAATPVARPSLAAATGTATRTTFDTTTVTTAQLAERVKALIDDMRAYGLEG